MAKLMANRWFDSFAGQDWEDQPDAPFMLRMIVLGKEASPRHPLFEMFLELGLSYIEPILQGIPIKTASGVLTFVFPERHMSVHESRYLIPNLLKNESIGQVKQVDILTQQPLIVMQAESGRWEGCLRVMTPQDDKIKRDFENMAAVYKRPEVKNKKN